MPTAIRNSTKLTYVFFHAIISVYIFVFMDWLFYVTKISFFDATSLLEKLRVLAISPLFFVIFLSILFLLCILPINLIKNRIIFTSISSILSIIPPLICSIVLILLIENFTYTIFGVSMEKFGWPGRIVYAILFMAIFANIYVRYVRHIRDLKTKLRFRGLAGLTIFMISVSVAVLSSAQLRFWYLDFENGSHFGAYERNTGAASPLPNILILSTDGLSASRMSIYGYAKDTTPFLKSVRDEFLLFENSFSNASQTTGSRASLLSGKHPTATKVIFRPDIFRGRDVYQHLPGLLRLYGYKNIDISLRYYADPFDLNFRSGFNVINGRRMDREDYLRNFFRLSSTPFGLEAYFLGIIIDRVFTRILHVTGVEDISNPYIAATKQWEELFDDRHRIAQLFRFIDETEGPFFASVFLMGTHGEYFFPRKRQFSVGIEQTELWMDAFYDDAVLNFDGYVQEIFGELKRMGVYENTLIFITSDHGMKWTAQNRVPLLVKFPHGQYRGAESQNVQRLDIAPTILDFLGIDVPSWMNGTSLLALSDGNLRPIISSLSKKPRKISAWRWFVVEFEPPFFTLGAVMLVQCHKYYVLYLEYGGMKSGRVEGHTAPCEDRKLMSEASARQFVIRHLRENGYDVSSVRDDQKD